MGLIYWTNPLRHLVSGSAALDALAASRALFAEDMIRWEDLSVQPTSLSISAF